MTRALRVLGRLLFFRPLVVILLVMFYLVAAYLLVAVESDGRALVVALLSAFATGGLAATMTERIKRHCFAAGQLGLPAHAATIRLTQGWFLVFFVAGPTIVGSLLGMSPLASGAVLTAACGFGIILVSYPWCMVLAPILGKWTSLGQWVAYPAFQAFALAASCWLIWRWFELPEKAEKTSVHAHARFADAAHEQLPHHHSQLSQSAQEQPPPAILSSADNAALPDPRQSVATSLASSLGYSLKTVWRGVLYGIGLGIAVMFVCHTLSGPRAEPGTYLVVTAMCCVGLVGRLQVLLQRWMQTSAEQSLLRITPRFPEAQQVKRAVIRSTLSVQRGSIATWMAISGAAVLFHWVNGWLLAAGALCMVGTSLAFSGVVWAVLARRRIRRWQMSTLGLPFAVAVGALIVLFGDPLGAHPFGAHVFYGAMAMIMPPALALAWYVLAPLRLPVEVDVAALQSGLY